MKLKVHAGEFQGPKNVIDAIETLNIDELQHGISSIKDEKLIDILKV